MQYLSYATVREIIDLSEARLAAIPRDQTRDQVLEGILGDPNAEDLALRNSLSSLNHYQALDLVAMMYAGQYLVENEQFEYCEGDDEGFEEELPSETYEDIYKDHIRNFQHRDVQTLISMCEQKASVLHKYLKAALERH